MPSPDAGRDVRADGSHREDGVSPARRRLLGAVVTGALVASSGCTWIQTHVFGRTPHPPGTVVVSNEDDREHDVRVYSKTGEHGGSVVAEREFSLAPTDERVLERFLEAEARHRVTATLGNGEAVDFDFRPHEDTGRVAVLTVEDTGSLTWTVEET